MTAEPERTIIQHDLYLVDEATGEIVGHVEETERFHVHDQGSAEWVLSKWFEADSELAALEARKKVLLANIDAMQRDHQRRLDWLNLRFGDELREWARTELEGSKSRTLKTVFAKLSFRKLKAKLLVHDEEKAVAWAKVNQPQAVKTTEKLLVSMLENVYDDFEAPGLSIEPARDKFSVDTGVKP